MKLQTIVEIEPLTPRIEYSDGCVMLGSCFAQRMGAALERAKFRVVTNPTGVLFNPLSIALAVERFVERREVMAEELHEGAGGAGGAEGWFHFDMHSMLDALTRDEALAGMNAAINAAHTALAQSRWVVVTLGTAWVYELGDEEAGYRVVANCHKQPARIFRRRRLTIAEAEAACERIVELLPDKQIIFTLSPIRHLADGACDNSVSKATLRLAIENVVNRYENVHYFAAYEVVLDELRDYRFYADDMAHPSAMASEYVWERFCEAALSPTARATMERVMRVVAAAEHRPRNPRSEAYAEFCRAQIKAIEGLPQVEFGKEYEYFSKNSKINL